MEDDKINKLLPLESPFQERFLVLGSAHEGMSSWRHEMADLIVFAMALNLTLVEPCFLQGRLVPCTAMLKFRKKRRLITTDLSAVIDINKLDYVPSMASLAKVSTIVSERELLNVCIGPDKGCHDYDLSKLWASSPLIQLPHKDSPFGKIELVKLIKEHPNARIIVLFSLRRNFLSGINQKMQHNINRDMHFPDKLRKISRTALS